jgi:hypothetical protein
LVAKTVTLAVEGSCAGPYATVTFANTPLTDLVCSVDSLVMGGTSSTISCNGLPPVSTDAGGDGSFTLSGVAPGTYTCTLTVGP